MLQEKRCKTSTRTGEWPTKPRHDNVFSRFAAKIPFLRPGDPPYDARLFPAGRIERLPRNDPRNHLLLRKRAAAPQVIAGAWARVWQMNCLLEGVHATHDAHKERRKAASRLGTRRIWRKEPLS